MNDGRISNPLEIYRIISGPRRYIENVSKRDKSLKHEIFYDACPTEIDSHADTHCFGRNFRPLYWTGHECSVAPFLSEYSEQNNIPICTGATSFTMDSGEVLILVLGQGLWFGNRMDKSLINPYQCRAYGIPLCDDPTDPFRCLAIDVDEYTSIPLEMKGTTCGLITRYPTDQEIDNCRHITLSDEDDWNPSKIHFEVSLMQAEKSHLNLSSRIICETKGYFPTAAPVTYIQDDIVLHEYDCAMVNVSLGLVQDLMVDRLIANVKVQKTRMGYATLTNERHHGVTADLLATKWGIGIEKAKATLKCNTQNCTRLALIPLTSQDRFNVTTLKKTINYLVYGYVVCQREITSR